MNLGLYLYEIRRWALFAILPALVVGALAYGRTAIEPKTYQTTTSLYVAAQDQNAGSMPASTDIQASTQLIPTYSQIVQLPIIANAVDAAMAKQYPGYALGGHKLSVSSGGTANTGSATQIMNISVQDTKPARAAAAANAVAVALIHEIARIQHSRFKGGEQALQQQIGLAQSNIQDVSQRMQSYTGPASGLNNLKAQLQTYQSIYQSLVTSEQEYNVTKNTALNSVRVLSPATAPSAPIGPHPTRNALLFAFIALLVCGAGIFVYDYFDDSARTPEEVEEIAGAPVLGTVQAFNAGKGSDRLVSSNARSPLAEAYRIIRTNLQFTDIDKQPQVIVVTSPSPSEGKSTTAGNLANVFADQGKRVVLVDADLRRPSLHHMFNASRDQGLTSVLLSENELNGGGMQPTPQENLALMASGPLPPRPADLLGSARMSSFVEHLRGKADVVVIDSPPILAVTDAAVMSTYADGVVLVVDPSQSTRREIVRAREAIEAVGGKILGVVVNRLKKQGSAYYYYYYQHNYGYQYKYDYSARKERTLGSGDSVESAETTTANK